MYEHYSTKYIYIYIFNYMYACAYIIIYIYIYIYIYLDNCIYIAACMVVYTCFYSDINGGPQTPSLIVCQEAATASSIL